MNDGNRIPGVRSGFGNSRRDWELDGVSALRAKRGIGAICPSRAQFMLCAILPCLLRRSIGGARRSFPKGKAKKRSAAVSFAVRYDFRAELVNKPNCARRMPPGRGAPGDTPGIACTTRIARGCIMLSETDFEFPIELARRPTSTAAAFRRLRRYENDDSAR